MATMTKRDGEVTYYGEKTKASPPQAKPPTHNRVTTSVPLEEAVAALMAVPTPELAKRVGLSRQSFYTLAGTEFAALKRKHAYCQALLTAVGYELVIQKKS